MLGSGKSIEKAYICWSTIKVKTIRIIPRLDIKGPNLVKGIQMEGLRVLGKPEDFSYQYFLDGADELIYMDVVASLYGRNSLLDIIRRTAEKVFIPLTVGGGIRTIENIREALRAGADKVAINTAAVNNPQLIRDAAQTFGSQCVVVSIEAKQKAPGQYEAYTDNGRERTGKDVFEWAHQAWKLGAGEILLTSVDRDGTGKGYDVELVREVSSLVPIPVIACGGAGKVEDVVELIQQARVDAVGVASIFHYNRLGQIIAQDQYKTEGNIEYLRTQSSQGAKRFQLSSCEDLKKSLNAEGLPIRPWQNDLAGSHNFSIGGSVGAPQIAVIDYGLGNLFSIQRALSYVGAQAFVTDDPQRILNADGVILPGVGAFGDGMANLKKKGLVPVLKEYVAAGKPFLGICLGMQLLMTQGEEFGVHQGLDLIKGEVKPLPLSIEEQRTFKLPHVGWNKLLSSGDDRAWAGTVLDGLQPGDCMYFVHSNAVVPAQKKNILAETEYGNFQFCSVVYQENIYGCQFHPEMSGERGLNIYRKFVFGIAGELRMRGKDYVGKK